MQRVDTGAMRERLRRSHNVSNEWLCSTDHDRPERTAQPIVNTDALSAMLDELDLLRAVYENLGSEHGLNALYDALNAYAAQFGEAQHG